MPGRRPRHDASCHVTTTVNGDPAEFLSEPGTTLLDALRDELGLTGSKEGCGSGDCGACSVIVDGRLVCSCLMLAAEAEGRRIETIEGMAQGGDLHPLQQKFLEHAALQCGFCTPGLLVAAKALLDANPDPTEERGALLAGRQPLPVHRLRQGDPRGARRRRGAETGTRRVCMTDVLDRPEAAGALRQRRHAADPPRRRRQGDRPRRVTAPTSSCPACWCGKVKRSPHAHARIVSIDTQQGAGAAGREGGGDRRRLPRPRLRG